MQADEPAVERNVQRLAALTELSHRVAPLKQRRAPHPRAGPALPVCEWTERGVWPLPWRWDLVVMGTVASCCHELCNVVTMS